MWHGLEALGWGWIAMAAVHMIVFWIVCIAVLIWIFSGRRARGESAMDILKARLAKGELSVGDFERLRRELLAPEDRR